MNKTKLALVAMIGIFFFACNEKEAAKVQNTVPETAEKPAGEVTPLAEAAEKYVVGTFTDSRNGKAYKTVKIGEQVWMAENLNYNASGSKCYNDSTANCDKYGSLYNWETAMKACPSGWHLPTNKEWETLLSSLGGKRESYQGEECECEIVSYTGVANKLKSKGGFSALLGGTFLQGDYDESHVTFESIGDYGCWFSASPGNSAGEIWFMSEDGARVKSLEYKEGCSVRCVKD
jgi:uncharacterized protein (TIGR02145 family)